MTQVRVNIRSLLNTAAVREETRNGRAVLIVPSATLPDDVVMNGIRYPADEIGKSFHTLNNTPAPCGHPIIGGQYVSARDPEAINHNYIGAWNDNARRQNGRVLLDKVIDIAIANQSEKGRAVLAAITEGKPVHTSTGLNCDLGKDETGKADFVALNMVFDHDAILLEEAGAATPLDGVGMLVNGQQIRVINSAIEWAERDLDYAVGDVVSALERREKATFIERMKAAILETLGGMSGMQTQKGVEKMDDQERIASLEQQLSELRTNSAAAVTSAVQQATAEAVAVAIKPLLEAEAARVANAQALETAELTDLRARIVKANLLGETAAAELTLNAARELAKACDPLPAIGINGQPITSNAAQAFDLPKGEK